jgi:hypothetical protein
MKTFFKFYFFSNKNIKNLNSTAEYLNGLLGEGVVVRIVRSYVMLCTVCSRCVANAPYVLFLAIKHSFIILLVNKHCQRPSTCVGV